MSSGFVGFTNNQSGAAPGSWFRDGNVTVTNGSNMIVGVGTNWKLSPTPPARGDIFTVDGSSLYEIVNIASDLSIQLRSTYAGNTASASQYAIIRNTSATINTRLAGQVTKALNQKQLMIDEQNAWLVSKQPTENFTDSLGNVLPVKTPFQMEKDVENVVDKFGVYGVMPETQSQAIREQNRETYSASSYIHFGKHENGNINEGIWLEGDDPTEVKIGGTKGSSKSKYPILHVNGYIHELRDNFVLPTKPLSGSRVDLWGVETFTRVATSSDIAKANELGNKLFRTKDGITKIVVHQNRVFTGVDSDWSNIWPCLGKLEMTKGVAVNSLAGHAFVTDIENQGAFTDGNGSHFIVCGTISRRYTSAPQAIKMLLNVVDVRLSAWVMSSVEEAAKIKEKVKNGSYRGLEKLVWTVFDTQLSSTSSFKATAVADASVYSIGDICYIEQSDGTYHKVIITKASSGVIHWEGSEDGRLLNGIIVHEQSTNISVSGNFTTQDVVGQPSLILKTDALKNGWLGRWIPVIPDGSNKFYESVKKVISVFSSNSQYTQDNGASWTSEGWNPNAVTNGINEAISATRITIISYTAFANQTVEDENRPILNASAGVGDVLVTNSYEVSKGVLLNESVTGKIGKGIDYRNYRPLDYVVVGGMISDINTSMSALPADASEISCWQIVDNGQCSLMFYDGTNYHQLSIPYGYAQQKATAGEGDSKSSGILRRVAPNYYGVSYLN